MGAVFYVMAILGCGDAETACRQIGLVEARYASADACTAATGARLTEQNDLDFPVVTAECRPAARQLAAATMTDLHAD